MSTCLVIHGTWGDRSDFALADSLFCRVIKTAARHPLAFQRFDWSGKNSSVERSRAALSLRDTIDGFAESQLPIFLLAHSHGGNVAIEALRDERVASRVAGLVTLGTPFLSETVRHWVRFLSTLPGRMSVYSACIGIVSASVYAMLGAANSRHHPLYGLAGLLTLSSLLWLAVRSSRRDLFEGVAEAARVCSERIVVRNSGRLSTRLLVVNARSDEALWWLRHVFAVSSLPFALFSFGLVTTGWTMLSAIGFVTLFRVLRLFVDEKHIDWMIAPALVAVGAGLVALLLGIVAILVTKLLQRIIGTGEAISLWSDVVTRLRATRLPNVEVIEMHELEASLGQFHGGLWHSKYMRSGELADRIGQQFDKWHSDPAT